MQVLKEKNLIAERAIGVEEEVKEVIKVEEGGGKKRGALRKGSEGEEVKAMQVCSQHAFLL